MTDSAPFLVLSYTGSIALIVLGFRMLNERILLSYGSKTRNRLVKIGDRPVVAAVMGFSFTAGFQSFSGVSVLLMSLINASLVSPATAFAVMIGAGVGLAVPLWVLTTGGFILDVGSWALAALAIAVPLSMVRKRAIARFGAGAFRFLLVLLGIVLLKSWLPDSSQAPLPLLFVRGLAHNPILFDLGGFAVGILLSIVTQSTNAVLVTALWLGWSGWLPLSPGLAMVFGSEIGAVLTVFRAAREYGDESRDFATALSLRMLLAALAGLAVATPIEKLLVRLFTDSFYKTSLVPVFLAAAFTLWIAAFGLLTMAGRQVFLKAARRIRKKLPESGGTDDLPVIAMGLPDSLEANLITTRHEIGRMAETAHRMLMEVLNASQDLTAAETYGRKIAELHSKLVLARTRIERFLTVMVRQPTGADQARDITAQIRVGRSLCSIGDCCVDVTTVLERIRRKRYKIHDEALDELYAFIAKVLDFLKYDGDYLVRKLKKYDQKLALTMESQVNGVRDRLRKRVRKTLEKDEDADIRGELQFMEIVRYLEQIGDECLVIAQEIPKLR